MVDLLSEGRLNMGVGTGSQPLEAQGMGTIYENRINDFNHNLDDIIRRWEGVSEGEISIETVNVVPMQKPTPPIYVTSNLTDMAYKIGLAGRSLLTIVTPKVNSLDEIGERISSHKKGLLEGGHDSSSTEVVVIVFTHVNESEEKAKEVAIPALGNLLSALSGNEIPNATDIYAMMQSKGTGLFGSEQQVSGIIQQYEKVGVEHIACLNRFGAMNWGDAKQSLLRLR